MLSDEEKDKRYQEKKKVDIDEKDKYTWVSIFKYIVETIFWANCGWDRVICLQPLLEYIWWESLYEGLTHAIIWLG